jgi:hypothetical protein
LMSKKFETELNAKVTKPFFKQTKPYLQHVREQVTFNWAILPNGPSRLGEINKKLLQFQLLSCWKVKTTFLWDNYILTLKCKCTFSPQQYLITLSTPFLFFLKNN